jgi:hypothetical protein
MPFIFLMLSLRIGCHWNTYEKIEFYATKILRRKLETLREGGVGVSRMFAYSER